MFENNRYANFVVPTRSSTSHLTFTFTFAQVPILFVLEFHPMTTFLSLLIAQLL